jgi:hypothetical protein
VPPPRPFSPQRFAPSSSAYPWPKPPNIEHRRRVPFLSATGAPSPLHRSILASVSSAPSPSPSPHHRGEHWCRVVPLGELRSSSVPPVDHGAARSTDPWTRSIEFFIEKYFIFCYILRNLHRGPRVLFKLQHSPQFQILFNI